MKHLNNEQISEIWHSASFLEQLESELFLNRLREETEKTGHIMGDRGNKVLLLAYCTSQYDKNNNEPLEGKIYNEPKSNVKC